MRAWGSRDLNPARTGEHGVGVDALALGRLPAVVEARELGEKTGKKQPE